MLTKEEILEAIRKATKGNGGTPLGISRFKNETGITDSEWQKHWARFNDLKREAGVKVTPFPLSGFSDEHVFEQFILLTRELEKIPVTGELIVKHVHDQNFPSVAVFQRLFSRLGGIHKFVIELLQYAENKSYKDIIKLCKSQLKKKKITKSEDDTVETVETVDFAYVYLGKRGYHYKVGVAKDLPRRKIQLEILQPEDFEYLHVIKTDDPYKIEAYWKARFSPKLIKGTKEWFKLNSSDIKAFKRWKLIF